MIFVAYGANLPSAVGDPIQTYDEMRHILVDNGVDIIASSSLWESEPVGTPDEQPLYINAVMQVETHLKPEPLLDMLLHVESLFGRTRPHRFSAKCIDLDLIAYQDLVLNQGEDLIVPHPRLQDRAFVLYPLREIAPNWVHPQLSKSVDELIAAMPAGQVLRKI